MPTENDKRYLVLIPAYKPDERLITLTEALVARGLSVLLVDDGGQERFLHIFARCEQAGAHVVRHAVNMGKGRALKTGLNEILLRFADVRGVVTADADGQHTPDDIEKVIAAMEEHPRALVLGSRAFTGNVPFKSRAGNAITRVVYHLASGVRVYDTQTGLRGLPADSLQAMVAIDGERYEYEMNVLLKLREMSMPVVEVPIQTIYIDDNKGSHFHPVRDAWRIYRVILRFIFSSAASFAIDYGLYLLLYPLFARLFLAHPGWAAGVSYAASRIVSSLVNYHLNKHTVFGGQGGHSAIVRYYALAAVQLLVGAGLTSLLARVVPAGLAKLPIDACLFCISFIIQRDFVFRSRHHRKASRDA